MGGKVKRSIRGGERERERMKQGWKVTQFVKGGSGWAMLQCHWFLARYDPVSPGLCPATYTFQSSSRKRFLGQIHSKIHTSFKKKEESNYFFSPVNLSHHFCNFFYIFVSNNWNIIKLIFQIFSFSPYNFFIKVGRLAIF